MEDLENRYNFSVSENRSDAPQLAVEVASALIDFQAGLDVQYDVVEDAQAESFLPEVVFDEDEQDALAFPIDAARSVEGGQADVDFRLLQLFDAILDAEKNLAENDGDLGYQNLLARAREEYRYTKDYASKTAAQQAGLSEEEKAAAEAAASGEEQDDGIEEVPVDPAEEQRLIELIQKQREEEQRIKQELVEQAQRELEAAQEEQRKKEEEAAAAAEAAAKAEEEKKQADALFALLENNTAESTRRKKNRRKLEERPDPLTLAFCMSEFVTGTFNQDCMDFARAEKEAKDAAAEEAKRAQEEAEAAKKAAEEEAAAKEDGVTDAWTTEVNTGGKSVAEEIADIEKQLAIKKLALAKDKDNQDIIREIG